MARIDNLQFLEDIIPMTTTLGQFKAKKAARDKAAGILQNGQTTLDGQRNLAPQEAADIAHQNYLHGVHAAEKAAREQSHQNTPGQANGQQYIFEHYEPEGSHRRDTSGDVEMS